MFRSLRKNPLAGDLVKGAGGIRKVRFAGQGKGKSGAYRVISFFASASMPLFLLTVYAKGSKVDLTKAEANALGKLCETLAKTYANRLLSLSGQAG